MHGSAGTGPLEIAVNHWPAPVVPTTLIAFWPGDARPVRETLVKRSSAIGVRIENQQADAQAANLAWHFVAQLPNAPEKSYIWCEANTDENKIGDAALDACSWIVGLQTVLDANDPAGTYDSILAAMLELAPETPAVLDVNTSLCHARETIESMRFDDAPPATDWLWRVDVVQEAQAKPGRFDHDAKVQLRTAGLDRCARPELAIDNVPHHLIDPAVTLLNILADHFIDQTPPEPVMPFAIGPDIYLQLQSVGGADGTQFAQVVADKSDGNQECPLAALEQIADGAAPLYVSTRATARQAALARREWHALEQMYLDNAQHRYYVKAAVQSTDNNSGEREHIWLHITSIEDGRVNAKLMHNNLVTNDFAEEDIFIIDPSGITDWRIETPSGLIGPSDVQRMSNQMP